MLTNKVAVLWYFTWKHKTDFCGETLINHPKKWNKEDFCVLASLLPFHLGIIKANRNEFVHVLRLRNCFFPLRSLGRSWLSRLFWPFMFWLVFPFRQPLYTHSFFNFRPSLHKLPHAICCWFLCQQHKAAHIANSCPIPLFHSGFMLRNAIQDNSCTNLACMLHSRTKLLSGIHICQSVGWDLICPAGPLFTRQLAKQWNAKRKSLQLACQQWPGVRGVCVMCLQGIYYAVNPLFCNVFRELFIAATRQLRVFQLKSKKK